MDRVPGVELTGYLSAAVGVGEAARRYVGALRSAGVPVLERDVPLPGRDSAQPELPAGPRPSADAVAFNLLCLNPEQMVPYLDGPDAPALTDRMTIGIWSWEVDVLPTGWREASERLVEVWTYSRFAAALIGAELGIPVLGFPPPLAYLGEDGSRPAPATLELPAGFRVLIMFDYLSTLERKNPLGGIEAYRRAFQPGDGAVLVVKSVNGRHRPERQQEVMAAVEGRPDVVVIDRTLSGGERDALLAACDCYLSLHRSEGHGLPLAEAMSLGKPVVATAYGGNIEFMDEANSYLVACAPAPVGEQVEHYPAGATWAEPDVEHAARLLRAIHRDPRAARSRAQRGRSDVQTLLAPEAVGARIRHRLHELRENPASVARRPT
jgi:glycosyltransferase involved in cell wall biosynthesis